MIPLFKTRTYTIDCEATAIIGSVSMATGLQIEIGCEASVINSHVGIADDLGIYIDCESTFISDTEHAFSADVVRIDVFAVLRSLTVDDILRYAHRTVVADVERVESEETPAILRYVRY